MNKVIIQLLIREKVRMGIRECHILMYKMLSWIPLYPTLDAQVILVRESKNGYKGMSYLDVQNAVMDTV